MAARAENASPPAAPPAVARPSSDVSGLPRGGVRLRALVLIRWGAVAGQAFTAAVVHWGLGFGMPVLAVGEDGTILFANAAFGAMLGYPVADVLTMKFDDIFGVAPDESVVSVVRAHADLLVELQHADGSTVRAKLSRSALLRGDDPVALATFQDLTEQLWEAEK